MALYSDATKQRIAPYINTLMLFSYELEDFGTPEINNNSEKIEWLISQAKKIIDNEPIDNNLPLSEILSSIKSYYLTPSNYNRLDEFCKGPCGETIVNNGIVREILAEALIRNIIFLRRKEAGDLNVLNDEAIEKEFANFIFSIQENQDNPQQADNYQYVINRAFTAEEQQFLTQNQLSTDNVNNYIGNFRDNNIFNTRVNNNLFRDLARRDSTIQDNLAHLSHIFSLLAAFDNTKISKFLAKLHNSNILYLMLLSKIITTAIFTGIILTQPWINAYKYLKGQCRFIDIFRPFKLLIIYIKLGYINNTIVTFDSVFIRTCKIILLTLFNFTWFSLTPFLEIPYAIFKYGFIFGIKHNLNDLILNIKHHGFCNKGNLIHLARASKAAAFSLIPTVVTLSSIYFKGNKNLLLGMKEGLLLTLNYAGSLVLLSLSILGGGIAIEESLNCLNRTASLNKGVLWAGFITDVLKNMYSLLDNNTKYYLSYLQPYYEGVENDYPADAQHFTARPLQFINNINHGLHNEEQNNATIFGLNILTQRNEQAQLNR
ncbi:hypothetical protein [Rickettsiales endosymbiont of Stachyamoeba lipophora]|uniref:hypothetical protein n=1 Tax=Rickettsiales endosymbiont of Stachyamoeba lipophora TaxID=2486578 RepID=UPI000F65587C|nr:hypothetical protein [Rickettsiales endosymbiont of Stachyamoeba lipophora]AZL15101.1 hypothetical protein EF513_00795 [Rickettsiales endosymbiont of Stachyamoeba lipophora]